MAVAASIEYADVDEAGPVDRGQQRRPDRGRGELGMGGSEVEQDGRERRARIAQQAAAVRRAELGGEFRRQAGRRVQLAGAVVRGQALTIGVEPEVDARRGTATGARGAGSGARSSANRAAA